VQEIRGWSAVTKVPAHAGLVVRGHQSSRRVVPIIDLRVKFNFSSAEYNETTVVIILTVATRVVGVVVDGVSDVITLGAAQIKPAPSLGRARKRTTSSDSARSTSACGSSWTWKNSWPAPTWAWSTKRFTRKQDNEVRGSESTYPVVRGFSTLLVFAVIIAVFAAARVEPSRTRRSTSSRPKDWDTITLANGLRTDVRSMSARARIPERRPGESSGRSREAPQSFGAISRDDRRRLSGLDVEDKEAQSRLQTMREHHAPLKASRR
jgi:hypothetical protein